jgi:hypothetical protein
MESLKIVRYWKANKVDVFNTEYKFERNERPTEKTLTDVIVTEGEVQA